MEHEKLTKLLRTLPSDAAVRTSKCPDNHELAAMADGRLSAESGERLALHLADCDFCIAQLGVLKRSHDSEPGYQINEFVLARAGRMSQKNRRSIGHYAPRWASAAAIVLAVLLIFRWNSPSLEGLEAKGGSSPDPVPQVVEPRQSRNLDLDILKPSVITPANGDTVDPGSLKFHWTAIPGSLYYDVRIVTDGGDVIWQARVDDTELALPEDLQFEPDTDYFFRVDAYLASAKSISSHHVLFTVKEQH
jgi:hypothetical protein